MSRGRLKTHRHEGGLVGYRVFEFVVVGVRQQPAYTGVCGELFPPVGQRQFDSAHLGLAAVTIGFDIQRTKRRRDRNLVTDELLGDVISEQLDVGFQPRTEAAAQSDFVGFDFLGIDILVTEPGRYGRGERKHRQIGDELGFTLGFVEYGISIRLRGHQPERMATAKPANQ